jgi:putative hydrolase of the HAD superfamily
MFKGFVVAMVSAVVLDLDGTLFDHSSSARPGLSQWLAGLDVVLNTELGSAWFNAEARASSPGVRACLVGPSSGADACGTFLPLIGVPTDTDDDLDEDFVAGHLLATNSTRPAMRCRRSPGRRT